MLDKMSLCNRDIGDGSGPMSIMAWLMASRYLQVPTSGITVVVIQGSVMKWHEVGDEVFARV